MSARTPRPVLAAVATLLATFVAACGSSGTTTGATSQPRVTLRFSCPCTTDQPQTMAMQRFADEVKKNTGGAVTVTLFPNGSLLGQNVEFQGLQKDAVDIAYAAPDTFAPQVAEMEILLTPYLYTSWSQVEDAYHSADGQKFGPLAVQRLGVRPLDIQNLGARELNLTVTKHISTPADLSGVKLRMPSGPYWAKLGAAMGAQVTPVAFNEIYLALQTGTVEGQDNPVATDVANKFYDVTRQLILTNHVFSAVLPTINDQAWKRLSASEQAAVVQAFKDADSWADTQVQDQQNQDVTLMKQHRLEVYSPNVKAFQTAVLKAYLCDQTWTGQFLPGMLQSVEKTTRAALPTC